MGDPQSTQGVILVGMESNAPGAVQGQMLRVLDGALGMSRPAIIQNINRCRRGIPDATPADVVKRLNRDFLGAVAASGGAAGAAAIAPNGVSLAAAGLDMAGFTTASALYVLSLAELHGVGIDDLERRRALVMSVLIGESGSKVDIGKVAPKVGNHWGKTIVKAIPNNAIKQVNKVLGPRFVTKYGTKQGVLVLGKQMPLGLGAAIGAGGNTFFAMGVMRTAASAFGEPPAQWPEHLQQEPAPKASDLS